ncbi:MAG: glutamate racemase [Clostridia bacterium]|nr:glutamate racemase [Clostridia bacterium]
MNRPIALFDSGIGGLTVLQSVVEVLPNENYVYLADNAFFPYGVKSYHELEKRIKIITKYLVSLDAKAIVIACNTASLHLEAIKKIAKIPVVDVITPTCNKVFGVTQNNKVCLLATDATVRSQRYQQILQNRGIDVVAVGCSDFVPLAENGSYESAWADDIICQKLSGVTNENFDTVILGCTHFGLLKESITQVLGNKIYVECGVPTALYLRNILTNNNLLCNYGSVKLKVITTAKSSISESICNRFAFIFNDIVVEHIPL